MGTPPASGSLDQMRNVQRSSSRGAELAAATGDELNETSNDCDEVTKFVVVTQTTAVISWLALLSLAAGGDGRLWFFCESAQQHLLVQHPIRHGCPRGALETGHTEAGKRTAPAKRASSIKAVSVSRFTIQEHRTRPTKIHFAASLICTSRAGRPLVAWRMLCARHKRTRCGCNGALSLQHCTNT